MQPPHARNFVASGPRFREGDHVKLNVEIPGHGVVAARGDVTFRDERTGFGVHFSAFAWSGVRESCRMKGL